MTYDALTVKLLTLLSGEGRDSTNATIARCLLEHAGKVEALSVKRLAELAHVGTGSVSRFARDAGFASFAELSEAFALFGRSYERVEGESTVARARELAGYVAGSLDQAVQRLDVAALARLVDDVARYSRVSAYGLLKGQAAALDLQVDLLMQGKYIDTRNSFADQIDHIARAGRDELIVVFSYTGAYFEYADISQAMRRLDRPRIWMVCGARHEQPDYVSDLLLFSSDLDRLTHPYQLELVAGLIAQEYAARGSEGDAH